MDEVSTIAPAKPSRGKLAARWATLLATPKSASALAWVTSVTFHALLLVTAILVLPPLVQGLHKPSQEEINIPDTTLADDSDIGGMPNPGLGKDPTRDASQEDDPSVSDTRGWATRRNDDLSQALTGSAVAASDAVSDSQQKQSDGKD